MITKESIINSLYSAQETLSDLKRKYIDPGLNAAMLILYNSRWSSSKESIELTNFQDKDNQSQYFHFDELLIEDDKSKFCNK